MSAVVSVSECCDRTRNEGGASPGISIEVCLRGEHLGCNTGLFTGPSPMPYRFIDNNSSPGRSSDGSGLRAGGWLLTIGLWCGVTFVEGDPLRLSVLYGLIPVVGGSYNWVPWWWVV